MNYPIEKVAALIGARRFGNADETIEWLLTDSRSLCFPETTLFFALRTKRNDGHRYITDLYGRGVRNFVVEQLPNNYETQFADANFLRVENSLVALQRLAERHRDEFDIPVIGITGSNGKTVVKEWLNQILSPSMTVARSPRSYNSQIGVPLSVWHIDENTNVALIEAGISEPGEMKALCDIIQPTVCVMTNIGTAHQENFVSIEQKCREKLILAHDANVLVFCADDEVIRRQVEQLDFAGEILAWTREDRDVVMKVTNVVKQPTTTTVHYTFKGEQGKFVIPFIDEASLANCITCAVVALHLGVSKKQLEMLMPTLEPVAMRLEVKEGQNGCTIINDSYNSDINSLDIALDFVSRRPDHKGRKRTLILSDIKQSGLSAEVLYREVSALVEKRGVEKFIGIGKEISSQDSQIKIQEKYFFNDCK